MSLLQHRFAAISSPFRRSQQPQLFKIITISARRPVNPFRVVLTGGPGGGKTTAADLFRREIGERVIVVPEAATLLFSGGFPRLTNSSAQRSTQCAIYQVQRGLEDIQAARYPDRILLCDQVCQLFLILFNIGQDGVGHLHLIIDLYQGS